MSDTYNRIAGKRWILRPRAVRIEREDGRPYLWRLLLFRCPWFAVYLHVFLGDDDECQHDHPWPYVSLILWGGYWELSGRVWRWFRPGSIMFRRADHRHRIKRGSRRVPITLVVTGRKCRTWGFWTRAGEFIPWQQYHHKLHCDAVESEEVST